MINFSGAFPTLIKSDFEDLATLVNESAGANRTGLNVLILFYISPAIIACWNEL